jgi:hypothetical protein
MADEFLGSRQVDVVADNLEHFENRGLLPYDNWWLRE